MKLTTILVALCLSTVACSAIAALGHAEDVSDHSASFTKLSDVQRLSAHRDDLELDEIAGIFAETSAKDFNDVGSSLSVVKNLLNKVLADNEGTKASLNKSAAEVWACDYPNNLQLVLPLPKQTHNSFLALGERGNATETSPQTIVEALYNTMHTCNAHKHDLQNDYDNCEAELAAVKASRITLCEGYPDEMHPPTKCDENFNSYKQWVNHYFQEFNIKYDEAKRRYKECTDARQEEAILNKSIGDPPIEAQDQASCNYKKYVLDNKKIECFTAMTLARAGLCEEIDNLEQMCWNYFSCFEDTLKAYTARKNQAGKEVINQKLQWRLLSRANCLTDAIDASGNIDGAKMDACALVVAYDTSHLDITDPTLPAKKHCDVPPPINMKAAEEQHCAEIDSRNMQKSQTDDSVGIPWSEGYEYPVLPNKYRDFWVIPFYASQQAGVSRNEEDKQLLAEMHGMTMKGLVQLVWKGSQTIGNLLSHSGDQMLSVLSPGSVCHNVSGHSVGEVYNLSYWFATENNKPWNVTIQGKSHASISQTWGADGLNYTAEQDSVYICFNNTNTGNDWLALDDLHVSQISPGRRRRTTIPWSEGWETLGNGFPHEAWPTAADTSIMEFPATTAWTADGGTNQSIIIVRGPNSDYGWVHDPIKAYSGDFFLALQPGAPEICHVVEGHVASFEYWLSFWITRRPVNHTVDDVPVAGLEVGNSTLHLQVILDGIPTDMVNAAEGTRGWWKQRIVPYNATKSSVTICLKNVFTLQCNTDLCNNNHMIYLDDLSVSRFEPSTTSEYDGHATGRRRRRGTAHCSPDGEDCLNTRCCQNSDYKCYKTANRDQATCRQSKAEDSDTLWDLSQCARDFSNQGWNFSKWTDKTMNCKDTGCCQNPQSTCYEMGYSNWGYWRWGLCLPWDCKPSNNWMTCKMNDKSRTFKQCSQVGENCKDTRCCADSDYKCYKQDEHYASCLKLATCSVDQNITELPRPSVEWSCEMIDRDRTDCQVDWCGLKFCCQDPSLQCIDYNTNNEAKYCLNKDKFQTTSKQYIADKTWDGHVWNDNKVVG